MNLNLFIDQCFDFLDNILVCTNISTELETILKEKKILILKFK